MGRRPVGLTVKLRVIGFTFLQNVVDGGQEHSGNGDNRFLVPPAFLE